MSHEQKWKFSTHNLSLCGLATNLLSSHYANCRETQKTHEQEEITGMTTKPRFSARFRVAIPSNLSPLLPSAPTVENQNTKRTNANVNCRSCLRRITHEETEFSTQSILRAMDKFVKAVNVMDETILVPSRLMDLKISDEASGKELNKSRRRLAKELNNTDLYSVYSMINGVKNELLWGQPGAVQADASNNTSADDNVVKGHIRRPSTVSVASTSSAVSTTSDTDSETGIENDIGSESEDYTQVVSDKFRHHLHGLFHCLDHMTEAASYLTARYQIDIGGTV
jgi:hypothetical protein